MSLVVKIVLAIIGIVLVLPGLCGVLFFGAGTAEWIMNGFSFTGSGGYNFGSAMIGIGGASIIGSILLLTILFAATGWRTGASLCLPLAILGAITVGVGYAALVNEVTPGNMEEWVILQLGAIGGLALGFLPPFLVWRRAKGAGTSPA